MQETTKIQNFLESFDEIIEEQETVAKDQQILIINKLDSKDDLINGMKLLAQRANDYKEKIDDCDSKIKMWQGSKKMWSNRMKSFLELIGKTMENFKIEKNLTSDGVKISRTSKKVLEVDEDWLLGQYQVFADALQTQLPAYIKVSLSIDKTKLFAHVNQDESMLVNNPEKIHTRENITTNIKMQAVS